MAKFDKIVMSDPTRSRDRRAPRRDSRDRDVVLYCSWPNEATSARVALLLRAKGITRVRPLEGGIDAWLADNFPFVTESLEKNPVVL
jgi:rhodanese-related sulfurtransferase